MAIKINDGFSIGSISPIDSRIVLKTYADMKSVNDATQPSVYFALCEQDSCLYLYNKSNTVNENTGKFRKFEGGSNIWQGTKAEYEAQKDTIPNGSLIVITDDDEETGSAMVHWIGTSAEWKAVDKTSIPDGTVVILTDTNKDESSSSSSTVDIATEWSDIPSDEKIPSEKLILSIFDTITIDGKLYCGSIVDGHLALSSFKSNAGLYDINNNLIQELTLEQVKTDASGLKNYLTDDTRNIVLPDGVSSISNTTFNNRGDIISVSVPNSVTSVGNSSFANIVCVYYNGTLDISNKGMTVVNGYIENDFVYKDSTKQILVKYLNTDSSVTEVVVPDSVTTIGDYAFYGYSNLTSVTLPNGVTTIGFSSFASCTLARVNVPKNVTSIGNYAFLDVGAVYYYASLEIPSDKWGCPADKFYKYVNEDVIEGGDIGGGSVDIGGGDIGGGSVDLGGGSVDLGGSTVGGVVLP